MTGIHYTLKPIVPPILKLLWLEYRYEKNEIKLKQQRNTKFTKNDF